MKERMFLPVAHEREIDFFRLLMSNLMIQTLRFDPADMPEGDLGLRRLLGIPMPDRWELPEAKPQTIYFATDDFGCSYHWLLLPDTQDALVVGPYFLEEQSETDLMAILERHRLPPQLLPSLQNYCNTIPLIHQSNLLVMALTTLGEVLWGSQEHFSMHQVALSPFTFDELPAEDRSAHFEAMDIRLLEARYESEHRLTSAITQGKTRQALHLISRAQENLLEQRNTDHVRNFKNYGIVLNTLLRKAAEEGGVHPLHLDRLSSRCAKALEKCITTAEVYALFLQMVESYGELVRTHSLSKYSPLVRQVILRIESDLTADLGLHAHADALHVNASYLSAQFHRETGMKLTDYVNEKRMEHAAELLAKTKMQVQTIAQYCGITDVNYFTKLFRKLMGVTPSAYRAERQPN